MRMMICDKCKFVMINSHELYNGVIVMVSAKHSEHEKVPITIRGFQKEWPRAEREGPIPGPNRPLPPLVDTETNIISGGFFNILKVFFFIGDQSLAKTYNNLP